MAKAVAVAVVVAVVAAAVAASTFRSSNNRAAIYLGYNATYCRGLNFTMFVPGNCSAFYQCQSSNVWLNTCQAPLLYNHLNGFCDNAWNVRCNRAGAPVLAKGEDKDVRCSRVLFESEIGNAAAQNGRILFPPVNQCPPATQVKCFVAPCSTARPCKNIPEARCFDDYCGGCNARFFKVNTWQTERPVYEEVTHTCRA